MTTKSNPPSKTSPSLVIPLMPRVPSQFRAKIRVWFGKEKLPMLLLYHHDDTHQRSREDYYTLIGNKHVRFYSSLKFPTKGQNYMILHKQEKSPNACFITPYNKALITPEVFETGDYVGQTFMSFWEKAIHLINIDQHDEHSISSDSTNNSDSSPSLSMSHSNVSCHHWRFEYEGQRVDACFSKETNRPLVIHHPYIRLDFLDFDIRQQVNELFDPDRVSSVKCGPFGG